MVSQDSDSNIPNRMELHQGVPSFVLVVLGSLFTLLFETQREVMMSYQTTHGVDHSQLVYKATIGYTVAACVSSSIMLIGLVQCIGFMTCNPRLVKHNETIFVVGVCVLVMCLLSLFKFHRDP